MTQSGTYRCAQSSHALIRKVRCMLRIQLSMRVHETAYLTALSKTATPKLLDAGNQIWKRALGWVEIGFSKIAGFLVREEPTPQHIYIAKGTYCGPMPMLV